MFQEIKVKVEIVKVVVVVVVGTKKRGKLTGSLPTEAENFK